MSGGAGDARGRPDPGRPPAVGLAVRPEGSGFHARVWPAPPPPWGRLLGAPTLAAGAGFALAAWNHEAPERTALAILSLALFGGLGAVLSWLPGFLPMELEVDDGRVYWNGERYAWDRVGGAAAEGSCLRLLDRSGGTVDRLEHLRPDVAVWLAAAIEASVPTT